MRKTKKEIIDETVAFYTEDPTRRAYTPASGCEYLTTDGRRCAVGRCLLPGVGARLLYGNVTTEGCARSEDATVPLPRLEELLAPEYRGHIPQFWRELQNWHDDFLNWEVAGDFNRVAGAGLLHETWDNVPGDEEY